MKQELIRELMKQAGELAYEEHKAKCLKDGLNPSMPYGNNLGKTFEKFAELIVRECLSIVEPTEDSGDEWCVTLKGAAQEIREHFGVE